MADPLQTTRKIVDYILTILAAKIFMCPASRTLTYVLFRIVILYFFFTMNHWQRCYLFMFLTFYFVTHDHGIGIVLVLILPEILWNRTREAEFLAGKCHL